MILALYGHPDAGGYWEQHCHKALLLGGWTLIKNGSWKSVYWHNALKLVLVVYVDDFKMAGPKESLAKGWKLITDIGRIKMEPPTAVGRYLGCEHHIIEVEIEGDFDPRHAWIKQLQQEQKDKLKQPPDYTKGTTFQTEKRGDLLICQDPPNKFIPLDNTTLGPIQTKIPHDDVTKLEETIPMGPKNITTTFYDHEGTLIHLNYANESNRFVSLPPKYRHMYDKIHRIITFDDSRNVLRDAVLTREPKVGVSRYTSDGKTIIKSDDKATLFDTLPKAPRDIVTEFLDKQGRLIRPPLINESAMRFPPLTAESGGRWKDVTRIITKDSSGSMIRDASIIHNNDDEHKTKDQTRIVKVHRVPPRRTDNFLDIPNIGVDTQQFFKRKTYDHSTGKLIADERIEDQSKGSLTRALPEKGSTIRTEFFFWDRKKAKEKGTTKGKKNNEIYEVRYEGFHDSMR